MQSQQGILIAEQQPSSIRLPVANLDALLRQESALTPTTLRCVLRVVDNTTGQELREQATPAVLLVSYECLRLVIKRFAIYSKAALCNVRRRRTRTIVKWRHRCRMCTSWLAGTLLTGRAVRVKCRKKCIKRDFQLPYTSVRTWLVIALSAAR